MQQLGARGLIDPKRTAIRGSSAGQLTLDYFRIQLLLIFFHCTGGYTVLLTLVKRPEVFATGTSLYGVSDVARLAADTHKFESRYADGLLGGTPEEIPDVYKARSPVTHADRIEAPLLVSRAPWLIIRHAKEPWTC
jgi:Prolyl oligopeptidase family